MSKNPPCQLSCTINNGDEGMIPKQMHDSTVAKRYGPGPLFALTNNKKLLPKKMKTPNITVGYTKKYIHQKHIINAHRKIT